MERVSHPSAPSGLFQPGDPSINLAPTTVTSAIMNALQEELASLVENQGLVLTPGIYTQVEQAIRSIVAAQSVNPIVNGDFRLAQRDQVTSATAVTTSSTYVGPDRWLFDIGEVSETGTIQRVAFAAGQTDVPEAEYYIDFNKTTVLFPGGGKAIMSQRLEDANRFNGRNVALGFNAINLAGSGSPQVEVEFVQHFGTGGSPSADVSTIVGTLVNVQTIWTRHTATVALPSTSGKTFGTNGDDYLEVRLNYPLNQGNRCGFTNVALGPGTVDPGFVKRPLSDELRLAQRFYEKSYEFDIDPGTATATAASRAVHDESVTAIVQGLEERFRTPKRATPTVAWYSTDGTLGSILYNGANNTVNASSASKESRGAPSLTGSPATGIQEAVAHWTADAEL